MYHNPELVRVDACCCRGGPDNNNLATLPRRAPKVKNARKGFGFITFEREETMKELIKIGKVTICGMEVDLRKATPKQARVC